MSSRHETALRLELVPAKPRGRAPAVGELERRRLDEAQVVEAREAELAADEDLGSLLLGLERGAAPEVLEREAACLELGGERDRAARVEAAEAEAVGQNEHVRCEPVPAEVRALVYLPRQLALERLRDGRTADRAARIAGSVRAHEIAAA